MFSKNMKILSLFLVLAVVMVGALGAVSATGAATGDAGNTTASVTVDGENNFHQGDSASSVATGNITGVIETDAASTNGTSGVASIPSGAAVNSSTTTPDAGLNVTVDGYIYTNASADGILTNGVTVTATGTGISVGPDGSFASDETNYVVTINNAGLLQNGETYYMGITSPAAYAFSSDSKNYTDIAEATYYVPFTYSGNTLSLNPATVNVTYGDDWTFSGTLKDENGTIIKDTDVSYTVHNTADGATTTNDKTGTINTGSSGNYVLDNGKFATLNVGTYTVTFKTTPTSTTTSSIANGTLTINKKQVDLVAEVVNTTSPFGVENIIFATISDGNNLLNLDGANVKFNVTCLDPAYVNSFTMTKNTTNPYDKVTLGTLVPGVYTATVYCDDLANYNVTPVTVKFTVTQVATNLTADPSKVITDSVTSETITFHTNSTTGVEDKIAGTFSFVLYDANGNPVDVKTAPTTGTVFTGTYTIPTTISKGSYTLNATFKPTSAGYAASTVSVPITYNTALTLNTNITIEYAYNTTGNSTIINGTFGQKINGTVTVYQGKKSLGTITVTNGTFVFNTGELKLDAATYTFTFAFAGDDTYVPVNDTTKVIVNPIEIGKITTTNKTINDVNVNSVNKTFTLTLVNASNASQVIDYTGNVVYTIGGYEMGNVSMVNGKVTVDAKTLNGLSNGKNVVKFFVDTNYASENEVSVTINTKQLTSDIIAANISTNNATPITITGTIVNATEGTVVVDLINAKNETIASVLGNVAADGTFTVAFGNYANGVYTANITYNSTTGLSTNNTKNVTVTVNGTAPTPVVGNVTTNLTINSNFTEAYGEGLNLTGKLTDANGNPIVGQHIALNLTNPATGASKIYWVTTDTNGEYQLQINLFVGSYTASASFAGFTTADNKTYYLPSGPVNGTITVNNGTAPVDNRTATVLAFSNFTEKYGQALNFTGTLKTTNGTAIVGQKIALELFNKAGQSKVYWRTTDTDGAVQLPIELLAGDYTFKCSFAGDSTYQASNNQTGSITVTA